MGLNAGGFPRAFIPYVENMSGLISLDTIIGYNLYTNILLL